MTIARNDAGAPGSLRKKDTGESGNGGQFGTLTRTDADITVQPTDPVTGMRSQGRSGQLIANLCEEIDEERDGYAGALEVPAVDGRREYYLRPDGPDQIHVEYLYNHQHNNGTLSQATFDLNTGKATYIYDYSETYPDAGDEASIEESFDPGTGGEGIAQLLREHAVDDGGVEDQIKESFEDPHEAARDAYLRGIGVRRNSYPARRAMGW